MVNNILEANGIKSDLDFLYLARHVGTLHRCHTLDMNRRPTLAEHMLNCYYLFQWAHHNKLITPTLSEEQASQIKTYLLAHDLEETLTGDIPYTNPQSGDFDNQVRDRITSMFGLNTILPPELHNIAKTFDMIDFLITMTDDIDGIGEENIGSYKNRRKVTCITNAVTAIEKLQMNATYKVKVERLLQG